MGYFAKDGRENGRDERIKTGGFQVISVAVCDDDRYLLGKLEEWLYKLAEESGIFLEVDCFEDGDLLIEDIEKGSRFDLIYLDIRMEQMNGIAAAYKIREKDWTVQMVYVTSYEKYMKDTFRVSPVDFLVKPVEYKDFENTFHYVIKKIQGQDFYYRFRFKKKYFKLAMREILYFESICRVVQIVWEGGCFKEYNKLDVVEENLKQTKAQFFRIHKSYLVNYHHIVSFGHSEVLMSSGIKLPLGKKYRQLVEEQLRILMGKQKDVGNSNFRHRCDLI